MREHCLRAMFSTAFAPRGTASVLSKVTIAAAAVFMISALLISMPALSGNISVLQGNAETPVEAPAETAPEPVVEAGAANTNASAASANNNDANSNGALIETPATEAFSEDANAANTAGSANR